MKNFKNPHNKKRLHNLILCFAFLISCSEIASSANSKITLLDVDETENTQSLAGAVEDPLEPINRVIFGFNEIVDGILLGPLSILYNNIIPATPRKGVDNFLNNFFAPLNFVNYTLQGDLESVAETTVRFIINSTLGILGIFDVAEDMGIKKKSTTFNETFTKWQIPSGPYIILPIFGPSSFRDVAGKTADFYLNPLYRVSRNRKRAHNIHMQNYNMYRVLYGIDGFVARANLQESITNLKKMSDDYYSVLRSVYLQKQKFLEKKYQ